VVAHRYQCLRCLRTHRVYPKGISKDHISQRVKGLGILLYVVGLSYGAVSLALDALGVYMCKSRVYDAVQAAAERVPGMKHGQVFPAHSTPFEVSLLHQLCTLKLLYRIWGNVKHSMPPGHHDTEPDRGP